MMTNITCVEAFPTVKNIDKMRKVLGKYDFKEKAAYGKNVFYVEIAQPDLWQIKKVLDHYHFKYRAYNKNYERSSNYRGIFFNTHKGPYRCAYCGKRLDSAYIEVDHLIPVAKVKNKWWARILLRIHGISNINDPRNLVAACKKCNRAKSDKMGFWYIRGIFGKYRIFWIIRNILLMIIIAILLFFVFSVFPIF